MSWCSEWDEIDRDPLSGEIFLRKGVEETFWPAPTQRKPPTWADNIEDKAIRTVLGEVYIALAHGTITLAAIGTRTLLDAVMQRAVGDPPGGFRGKLDAMVEGGHLAAGDRNAIETMIDVGSAAAHRGYVPEFETLSRVLDAAESLLHRQLIFPKDSEEVKKRTPGRHRNGEDPSPMAD